MADAKNVSVRTEGTRLIIEVDMAQDLGPSSSGKTNMVASSGGFMKVGVDGVSMSLNVCRKPAR